ncbi:MAG: biopolymer transporter ExbD [Bacteroidia bacterium]|nr:biopolymer transporter ExbD [Bacteroidia bacterium]MCX7652363.1 biopolymer transporter ExbD [Bacteroidia bacterium]MDW8417663.1 biopolymer transporter ExbD [Bacteroidia bacterium]
MAAEVGGDSGAPKKGKKKGKARKPKKRPRIDMTPMVDLGFLLLTFFVLTTTMSTPNTMPVVVPPKITEKDEVEPPKIAEGKVITLLVGRAKVYYYVGVEKPELFQTTFSPKSGIRKVLLDRRQKVAQRYGKADEMIVIIKMLDEAQYKDFVDILDEMAIIQQKKYALVDITPEEKSMIEDYKKSIATRS